MVIHESDTGFEAPPAKAEAPLRNANGQGALYSVEGQNLVDPGILVLQGSRLDAPDGGGRATRMPLGRETLRGVIFCVQPKRESNR